MGHGVKAATEAPERKRGSRKPSLATALKQAKGACLPVKGATVAADGSVALTFGSPETEEANPWDGVLKNNANAKRPS